MSCILLHSVEDMYVVGDYLFPLVLVLNPLKNICINSVYHYR